jgi:YVTN family beta-propeller protein
VSPSTVVASVVSRAFDLVRTIANPAPEAPVDSPALWTVLAWARRQFGQVRADQTPVSTLDAQVTDQSVQDLTAEGAQPFTAFAAVAAVNSAPTAAPSQVLPNQTTGVVTGSINGTDVDGNTLSYKVSTAPSSGTVSVNASTGAFTYTPSQAARLAAGVTAAGDVDQFSVSVSDGQVTTPVTVAVPVLPSQLSTPQTTRVGSNPMGVVASASKIYVANSASNTVSVIDRTSGAVTTINVVSTPTAIALSSDGSRAYVAGNGAVSVINTTSNAVVSQVATQGGQSFGLAVSPNGQRVYVTNTWNNTVSVIDTSKATPALVATVQVGSTPGGITVSPDGTKVYVANFGANTVSVINTATNSVVGKPIAVGANPYGLAVSPDGSRVYVGNFSSNSVSVIDAAAATPATISTIGVGALPFGIALSPDGTVLYVANGADTVSVINTKTGAVTSTVTVDSAPEYSWHGIAISPDGRQIYVSDMSDAAVRALTVNRGNTAPVAGTPTVGAPDASTGIVKGTLNFTDPDGDALSYSVPTQPAGGTVVVNSNGAFTYTPTSTALAAAAIQGPTSLTFSVNASDGQATKSVSVTVPISGSAGTPASPPPVSNPPTTPPVSNPPTTPPVSIPSGDATAYLQAKFDALKPGDTLTLSPGVYQHSGVLQIRVSGVTINGNGATLQATNDATSAVQILADNVTVSNLTLTAPLTGPRYDSLAQHKLVIEGNGNTINDVTINGSAAAGVFVYGASNFTLNRVIVMNTRADGIHMTHGANNGHVNYAVTQNTGDDGISVISYSGEPIDHDIVITSPTVIGTTWGRGLSVVGGQNISYTNINVSGTDAAGVYIASEGSPWNTLSTNNVTITGGTVTGANTSKTTQQGAVLIYNGNANQSVTNVTISGLTISGTPSSAYRNVGIVLGAGKISNIAFNNIVVTNTTAVPFATSSNVTRSMYTTSGWTLNGRSIAV